MEFQGISEMKFQSIGSNLNYTDKQMLIKQK